MSYKIDEATLMDYLYGELSAEEMKKVEAHLLENVDARKELEELKEAQGLLGKIKDREVDVPQFTFQQPTLVMGGGTPFSWWKYPMGIAASLALVMLIGYLTSFNMSVRDGGLQVAFGEPAQEEETFSRDEVANMIQVALASNNEQVNQRLASSESNIMQKVSQQSGQIDQDLLNEYTVRLREFNRETLASMLENAESSQKDYTNRALQELAIYLDVQRQEDLDLIRTQFQNFEDNAEYNQLQTNRILTNLMTSATEPTLNQY